MKRALQILSAALAVVVIAIWLVQGANTRWTKNRVQVIAIDPVTEIEAPVWQDKFLPGVDFLGGGLAVAAGLLIASRFIRKTTNQ